MKVKLGARAEYWDRMAGEYVIRQSIFTLTDKGRPIRAMVVETRTPAPKGGIGKVDRRGLEKAIREARKTHEKKLEAMVKRLSIS